MAKDLFYFSKSDRIATIIMLAVILVTTIIRISPKLNNKVVETVTSDTLQWVPQTNFVEQKKPERARGERDSSVLSQKVYTRRLYSRESNNVRSVQVNNNPDTVRKLRYPVKTAPLNPIELNSVDSTELVSLPGIGQYYASRILQYREQLGGYVSVTQLMEIDGLPDSLVKWFFIQDSVPYRKLLVNKESLSSLRRHPYMNFYQAREIIEFRRDRGKLKGPEQLSILDVFSDQDLERLIPYLDFR